MKEKIHFVSEKENRFLRRQMFWKIIIKGSKYLEVLLKLKIMEKTCMYNKQK